MPFIKIQTNIELSDDRKKEFLLSLSEFLSKELGKPQKYIMGIIENSQNMIFGGTYDDLAFIELRSIRLPEQRTKSLSKSLTSLVKDHFKIDGDRVFINFVNIEPHLWGYDSDTFSKK